MAFNIIMIIATYTKYARIYVVYLYCKSLNRIKVNVNITESTHYDYSTHYTDSPLPFLSIQLSRDNTGIRETNLFMSSLQKLRVTITINFYYLMHSQTHK